MDKLRNLILDSNQIEKLPAYGLGQLTRLQRLSAAGNSLQYIDEKMFHARYAVDFNSDKTVKNSCSSNRELRSLDLSKNKIEALTGRAFAQLENLQQLLLKGNKLRMVDTFVSIHIFLRKVLKSEATTHAHIQ